MSPRVLIVVAVLGVPACYVGLDEDALVGSSGAGSSGGGPTGPTGPTSNSGGPGSDSDAPTSAGPGSSAGSTDMSAGPGSDSASTEPGSSGGVMTGGPETSGPGTSGPGTSDTDSTSGSTSGDPPPDEAAQLCERWNGDRAQLGEGSWSGAVNGCNKGAMSQDGRDNALRLVNLYRWIAELPPVAEDAAKTGKAQACALMMHANGQLSHSPPMNWKCYSAEGAEAAGKSNISGGPGVFSVDLYMIDVGNETTMGHRRWILSNSLGPIGLGSTSEYSCMFVIGGAGNAGKQWLAWPPPGLVPLQAMHVETVGWSDVDLAGWTVQSDSVDLNSATVSVKEGGVDKPVKVNVLGGGYGSSSAVRFVPQGWKVQAGKTYDVQLGGVNPAIAYSVTIVDCG